MIGITTEEILFSDVYSCELCVLCTSNVPTFKFVESNFFFKCLFLFMWGIKKIKLVFVTSPKFKAWRATEGIF